MIYLAVPGFTFSLELYDSQLHFSKHLILFYARVTLVHPLTRSSGHRNYPSSSGAAQRILESSREVIFPGICKCSPNIEGLRDGKFRLDVPVEVTNFLKNDSVYKR